MKYFFKNIELFGDMITGFFVLTVLVNLSLTYQNYPKIAWVSYVILVLGFCIGFLYQQIRNPKKLLLLMLVIGVFLFIHYSSWGFFIAIICGQHAYFKHVKAYEQ